MVFFWTFVTHWCPFSHFPFRKPKALSYTIVEYSPQIWGNSRGSFLKVRSRQLFLRVLTAQRTAARANLHATSCIERTRQVLKWTLIGQMAIASALLRFNDLGRSVTPTFLFRNRCYLQLSPHCSKMNKKSTWEVKKNFKISVHGIWNPAILRLQGAWN